MTAFTKYLFHSCKCGNHQEILEKNTGKLTANWISSTSPKSQNIGFIELKRCYVVLQLIDDWANKALKGRQHYHRASPYGRSVTICKSPERAQAAPGQWAGLRPFPEGITLWQGLHGFDHWLHRAMPCFNDLARFGAIFIWSHSWLRVTITIPF